MIQVYQIDRDTVTSNPVAYEIFRELIFSGSKSYTPNAGKFYTNVANIAVDTFNAAFEIGNIGPEDCIVRHGSMRSVSEGDILVKPDTGETVMVDGVGFTSVQF